MDSNSPLEFVEDLDAPHDTFDQSEIDALFGDASAELGPSSGIEAIIGSRAVRNERLPVLESIIEHMIRSLSTGVRSLTSSPTEISLEQIDSSRFGDFMDRLPMPSLIGVISVHTLHGYALITMEADLIYAIVDALLGGGATASATVIDGRQFTSIETSLATKVTLLVLDEFCQAFSSVMPTEAQLERVEMHPRFAAIANPSDAAISIRMRFNMNRKNGCLNILLPYATLEPARAQLSQSFMGEQAGPRNLWRNHMESELRKTSLELQVLLGERTMRLQDVKNLAVGDVIRLDTVPDSPLDVRCNDVMVGKALAGRRNGRIAISTLAPLKAKT